MNKLYPKQLLVRLKLSTIVIMTMILIYFLFQFLVLNHYLGEFCQSNPNDYRVDFLVFVAVAVVVMMLQSENRCMNQPNLYSQVHRDYSFLHSQNFEPFFFCCCLNRMLFAMNHNSVYSGLLSTHICNLNFIRQTNETTHL